MPRLTGTGPSKGEGGVKPYQAPSLKKAPGAGKAWNFKCHCSNSVLSLRPHPVSCLTSPYLLYLWSLAYTYKHRFTGTVHRPHSREREWEWSETGTKVSCAHIVCMWHIMYIPGTSARLSFVFSYILVHLQLASVFALFFIVTFCWVIRGCPEMISAKRYVGMFWKIWGLIFRVLRNLISEYGEFWARSRNY